MAKKMKVNDEVIEFMADVDPVYATHNGSTKPCNKLSDKEFLKNILDLKAGQMVVIHKNTCMYYYDGSNWWQYCW
jgi:hypothetical protein